jgi:choline dehydrogenase
MMYVCGNDKDYNGWADSTGDTSWNYQNMLQYIIKHQNMEDKTLTTGTCAPYHGTQGRLRINDVGYDHDPIIYYLRKAAAELNYTELVDINCGPDVGWHGFVNIRQTISGGQRESAARAFLTPLNNHSNFYFMKNSFVDKVLVTKDSSGNVLVSGVNVVTSISKCKNIQLKAKREVILTAGALSTPKILLNSGIGRQTDLQPCSIPQILDLNVGNNLIDHPISLHFWTVPANPNLSVTSYNLKVIARAFQYVFSNKGYFSNFGAVSYGGFVNTLNRTSKYPDIQYIFYRLEQHMTEIDKVYHEKFGFIPSIANQLVELNKDHAIIQISNILLLPKSRGSVKIRACNARANPLIESGYFTDPSDMETMVRGYKALKAFFNSETMKNYGAKEIKIAIPECDALPSDSDDYIRCYIKYMSSNEYHPCSTAKMGNLSDPDAVVDSNLRVIGVKRGITPGVNTHPMLRVADASIMPMITSGNTQCPVYTIAEKAAAMILNDNP